MKKLLFILILCICSIVKGQTSCVTYKNMSYGWNTITKEWDNVDITYDKIKITCINDNIYVESKNMSHYTTYKSLGTELVDGVKVRRWMGYDEHNTILRIVTKYSKGIISFSFMYDDSMYSYYSVLN